MNANKIQSSLSKGYWAAIAAGMVTFAGASANAELLLGVTSGSSPGGSDNDIVTFDSAAPGIILSEFNISGLASGETIRGIDMWNGIVYGMGSQGHLYSLNYTTGAATPIGASFGIAPNGAAFGVENSPAGFHVVSELDQNLLVNRATGVATAGTAVNPGGGAAVFLDGLAWRASTSTMFGIDSLGNTVGTWNPVTGTYTTLGGGGAIGFDVARINGFDISDGTGIAYLVSGASSSDTQANLYQVNLTSGMASLSGLV